MSQQENVEEFLASALLTIRSTGNHTSTSQVAPTGQPSKPATPSQSRQPALPTGSSPFGALPPIMFPPNPIVASPSYSIRHEQVVAALKSKPQRGRKRNNLSDAERMELTRTRNREHAKSTRNRKKMRHLELEQKEADLLELQKSLRLQELRRAAVLNFCKLREGMLNGKTTPCSNNSTCGLLAPQFTMQFDEEAAGSIETSARAFDQQLRSRLFDRFGKTEASPLVSFKTDENDVALSLNGTAHLCFDVVSAEDMQTIFQSVHLKLKFCPSQSVLLSVKWQTVNDFIARMDHLVSHPSVVSLDPATRESEGGPGMNIDAPSLSED